ncbi:hypothetical protein [Parabacteroides provencensis]|uniref:hypothetical protein n=1 Tax=Parabacteroides provencensis TaxID=1944636 RepID=UPI000C150360|nr:hypothetical protein [Parabacteroides provencensis]
MVKVYKAHNILSVPIVVDGKIVVYVEFKDENHTFRTSDEIYQKALEGLPCFGKLFKLSESVGESEIKKDPIVELKELPEITDWQDAKDLLRKDYGVPHQSLNTPENILKKASEFGVSFPNLKIGENKE